VLSGQSVGAGPSSRSPRIWLNVGSSSTRGIGRTDEGARQPGKNLDNAVRRRAAHDLQFYSAASGISPEVSPEVAAGSSAAVLARNLSKAACKDRVACGEAGVVETTAIA
jgi:hypothetical protein